ncbi:dirigent protein [uncultured Shewanella sp.]|uniref:dirigent protein n=1 Tax=uncultured Shewanella sp. TaxID=173975 RepID=UPI0026090353|nr:dirigent protein [uncultured Shewanella sp.]
MRATKKINLICIGLLMSISCSTIAKEKTLVTIADAKTAPAIYIDLPPKGDSLGDQYLFDQPLLNDKKQKIGTNSGFCVRTRLNHSLQCQWTLSLQNGTIQVQGREFDKGISPIAIVGGTGQYRYIAGEMESKNNGDGTFLQTLTYSLLK